MSAQPAEKRALDEAPKSEDVNDAKRQKMDSPTDVNNAVDDTAGPENAAEGAASNGDAAKTAEKEEQTTSDKGSKQPVGNGISGAENDASTRDTENASANDKHAESGQEVKPEGEQQEAKNEQQGDGVDESKLPPLERATRVAERSRVHAVPELDPPQTPPEGSELPKHQHKYATSIIKAIKRLKDAGPFLQPVDPIKLGVPQYFDYIKHPMDLGTMEKKLAANEYGTVHKFVDDFNQIVSNCIIFNGTEALISKMALSIAGSFTKQLSNMPSWDDSTKKPMAEAKQQAAPKQMRAPGVPMLRRKSAVEGRPKREIRPPRSRDVDYHPRPRNKKFAPELKFCGHLLKELQSRKHEAITFPFLLPVDPVEQGVPNYFEVIKEPMDLSTMQRKLNEGMYYNADEFEADMRLMFRNCYTFNPEGTPVNELGHKVEELFDSRWVDKPDPAPTPPPHDTDESDYDFEYEESGISNPAIDVLESQLKTMRRQLQRLKRDALAEYHARRGRRYNRSRSLSTSAPKKTTSSKREVPQVINYDMKRELSEKIGTLPESKLATVINIIQESMPQLKQSGQDEIELEMDQLEPHTLRQLYAFVVLQRKDTGSIGSPTSELGAGATTPGSQDGKKKKKSKPLSEDEQNRQIEEIQNKLRQFDQVKEGTADTTPASSVAPGIPAEESSSDEDEAVGGIMSSDDSSSEEE